MSEPDQKDEIVEITLKDLVDENPLASKTVLQSLWEKSKAFSPEDLNAVLHLLAFRQARLLDKWSETGTPKQEARAQQACVEFFDFLVNNVAGTYASFLDGDDSCHNLMQAVHDAYEDMCSDDTGQPETVADQVLEAFGVSQDGDLKN